MKFPVIKRQEKKGRSIEICSGYLSGISVKLKTRGGGGNKGEIRKHTGVFLGKRSRMNLRYVFEGSVRFVPCVILNFEILPRDTGVDIAPFRRV
jgi:hypothetical protein